MSTKIGRFEILGELAKSESSCVYKANDPESGQTLALKAFRLDIYGEHADEVTQRILQEAETTKELNSSNLTLVYGAGEIDGQFCAAMEYIQGNSIATMLARKEGFSIWDLLDISRQVCQALDYTGEHNVFHYSLEPAKVMVTWDGTVKILSFGISSTGWAAAGAAGVPPNVLYYMSPEQLRTEPLDARSNLFSWGAMLYEMVTDRKAFEGVDADVVRQKILEEMPVPPALANPKINPVASDVIMRALAKDPADRYQSGREMVNDLEKCRETSGKTTKKPPAETSKGLVVPDSVKAAAAAKFAASSSQSPAASRAESKPLEAHHSDTSSSLSDELETSWTPAVATKPSEKPTKAAAAAAGSSAGAPATSPKSGPGDSSSHYIPSVVKDSIEALDNPMANMSAAVADEPQKPKIAVDPLMAEDAGAGQRGVSFSEMSELPPLKEVYVAPPAPETESAEPEEPLPSIVLRKTEPDKPKIQPREVAEKAIKEIKSIPPQLMIYSISAAVALIVIVCVAVFWHSQSQNTDEEGRAPAPAAAPATPAPRPAPPSTTEQPTPAQLAPEATQAEAPPEPVAEEPAHTVPLAAARARGKNKRSAPTPTAPIPGQLAVDSTPEGAQVQIDGRSDSSWVTPYTIPGLPPGQHSVLVSKSGFVQETRTVDVVAASKAFLVVHLGTLTATMNVTSEPAGASIYVDGKDTLKVTPSVITLDKGSHTVLVRKLGFLDETTSAAGTPGQTYHFASTLRPLGNADDIKTVGKFKKLFGGNAQAGMSKVSIRTSPKGAQISINRRMLDKMSPVEVLLNPGNYVVDITLTGYKPVQKVITVDQGGSTVIDETLQTP